MEVAVLHDRYQARRVLQDAHVGERVAIDEQQVGEVVGAELAELVRPAHDLAAPLRGGDERLHRRETQEIDE